MIELPEELQLEILQQYRGKTISKALYALEVAEDYWVSCNG